MKHSVGVGMDNVTLKLQISTLKAIVALCHVTGESLRQTFEHGHLEPNERRAVFVRWCQVRRDSGMAKAALEPLTRLENGPGHTPSCWGTRFRPLSHTSNQRS